MKRTKFTLTIEKADDYGYSALLKMEDQERSACRTTLPEILGWVAMHVGTICKESPYQPQTSSLPAQQEQIEPFPSIVAAMEHDRVTDPDPRLTQRIMDTVRSHGNGHMSALATGLWLSAAWLSMRVGGMA
jgi:hypothetical protein